MVFAISFVCLGFFSALISGQQLGMLIKGMAMGSRLYVISINLLVVYRESVNLIGYITRRLSADSLRQDSCSRDPLSSVYVHDPLSNLNQYTWRE